MAETEPIESGQRPQPKGRRGDSKKRNDRRKGGADKPAAKYGELVAELDGTKSTLKDTSKELQTTTAALKSAQERLAIVDSMSENALRLAGMQIDFWIGDPVRFWSWEWLVLLGAILALFPAARWGWEREAVVGLIGILFVFFWESWQSYEDSLGRRRWRYVRPDWTRRLVRTTLGSRRITFRRLLDERHEDLRHDANSLMSLKHPNAAYAEVELLNAEDDEMEVVTVSLELLSQLLAPKYMNTIDSETVVYERLKRDAARFNTIAISRYFLWTEHIYLATAEVAYAYAVHLRERNIGDFVLAPRPLDV